MVCLIFFYFDINFIRIIQIKVDSLEFLYKQLLHHRLVIRIVVRMHIVNMDFKNLNVSVILEPVVILITVVKFNINPIVLPRFVARTLIAVQESMPSNAFVHQDMLEIHIFNASVCKNT